MLYNKVVVKTGRKKKISSYVVTFVSCPSTACCQGGFTRTLVQVYFLGGLQDQNVGILNDFYTFKKIYFLPRNVTGLEPKTAASVSLPKSHNISKLFV